MHGLHAWAQPHTIKRVALGKSGSCALRSQPSPQPPRPRMLVSLRPLHLGACSAWRSIASTSDWERRLGAYQTVHGHQRLQELLRVFGQRDGVIPEEFCSRFVHFYSNDLPASERAAFFRMLVTEMGLEGALHARPSLQPPCMPHPLLVLQSRVSTLRRRSGKQHSSERRVQGPGRKLHTVPLKNWVPARARCIRRCFFLLASWREVSRTLGIGLG